MKICFVSPYSPREVTGIGTFLSELCKGLETRGHQSTIITILRGESPSYKEKSEINLIEVDCRKFRRFKDLYFCYRTFLELLKRRKDIDIIHTQQPHLQSLLSAVLGKIVGIPVLTTLHLKAPRPNHLIRKKALDFYENALPYFSNSVVFVSKMTKHEFGIQKGIVIYNGVDIKKYLPNDKTRNNVRSKLKLKDQFIILFSARYAENKGIFELLIALSKVLKLTDTNLKLILIGGGDTIITKKVFENIQELKIQEHVLPMGRVYNVLDYNQIADLFVLPTYFEGLPMALLEAMSCGLPVIASEVGGIVEVIENGVNGLFVKPKDINGLTEKIVWCIKHEKERLELGKKARQTVQDKYSLELMITNYLKIYSSLIAS